MSKKKKYTAAQTAGKYLSWNQRWDNDLGRYRYWVTYFKDRGAVAVRELGTEESRRFVDRERSFEKAHICADTIIKYSIKKQVRHDEKMAEILRSTSRRYRGNHSLFFLL